MKHDFARMKLLAGRMVQRINTEVEVPATGAAGFVTLGRVLTLPVPSGRFAVLCAARVVADPRTVGRGALLVGDKTPEVVPGSPGARDTEPGRDGCIAWGNNGVAPLAYAIGANGWFEHELADINGDLEEFMILPRDMNGETKLTLVATCDDGLVGSSAHFVIEYAFMHPLQALIVSLLQLGPISKADGNSKVDTLSTMETIMIASERANGAISGITQQAVTVQADTPPPPPAPVARDTLSNLLLPTSPSTANGTVTPSGAAVTSTQVTAGNLTSIGLAAATGGISLVVGMISKLLGF